MDINKEPDTSPADDGEDFECEQLAFDFPVVHVDPPKKTRSPRVPVLKPEPFDLGPLVRVPRKKPGPKWPPFVVVRSVNPDWRPPAKPAKKPKRPAKKAVKPAKKPPKEQPGGGAAPG